MTTPSESPDFVLERTGSMWLFFEFSSELVLNCTDEIVTTLKEAHLCFCLNRRSCDGNRTLGESPHRGQFRHAHPIGYENHQIDRFVC